MAAQQLHTCARAIAQAPRDAFAPRSTVALRSIQPSPPLPRPPRSRRVLVLAAKGAAKSKAKGGGAKQAAGAGFGSKPANGKATVDPLSLLRKSEQLYTKLLTELHQNNNSNNSNSKNNGSWSSDSNEDDTAHELVIREYIMCVRASQEAKAGASPQSGMDTGGVLLPDWLPVAELLLVSQGDAAGDLPRALPFVCREIAECAGLNLGSSFPRHVLEFAYEGAESFYDEVVTSMLGFGDLSSAGEGVTCPYTTLGVPKGAPLSQIRAAYRTLAAQHHPDRHADEHKESAEVKFKEVAEAYDTIRGNSGSMTVAGSMSGSYMALGGPKREGLSPPLRVRPSKGEDVLPPGIRMAVRPLEAELVEVFLARLMRRSSVAQTFA